MKTKYFIVMILATAILLSLASCQSADVPLQGNAETSSQQTIAEVTVAETAPAETVPEASAPALDGSFSTPDYEVTVIDGKCYLNFTDGNEATDNGDLAFESTAIAFSSLSEMKQKLLENQLTVEEIETIKKQFNRTENGFEICNVSNLMTTILPDGWHNTSVHLQGESYSISVTGEETDNICSSGSVDIYTQSRWDAKHEEDMAMIEAQTNISHMTDTFGEFPCEIYTYTTSTAKLKTIFLTIPGEDGKADTHIILKYRLETVHPDLDVSDTVPSRVYIYSEAHGIYYDYVLLDLTEAPTVEWLSSFSIAPYVDTGDHVVS